MHISIEKRDDSIIVKPNGRIDSHCVQEFEAQLYSTISNASDQIVVLDMANVEFISNGGLRAVLAGMKKCQEARCKLRVAGLNSVVEELFQISRVNTVVDCFDAVDLALTATVH